MPKVARVLTSLEVKNLGLGTFALGGVNGLYIRKSRVQQIFFYRYKDAHGRHDFVLGNYPELSLADARREAAEARDLVKDGKSPISKRRQDISREEEERQAALDAAQKEILTFEEAAEGWIEDRAKNGFWVRNPRGERETRLLLGKHIFPFLGSRDIESITAEDMRNCLARIWQSTPSSAKKVRTYVQKIFQWSMAKGLCQRLDNPAMMDGPLGVLLEPYQKNRKQKDVMAACSVKEIPRLMAEIMAYDSMSAKACAFAILTAARSQAVRMARWDEFDLENALWVIPLEHDKLKFSNRDRTIFLSTWAVSLLKKLPRFVECPYVFPSARGSHFSDVALTMFLRGLHEKRVAKDGRGWIDPAKSARLGKPCIITLHGTARATFRTWAKDDVLGNNRRFDQQAVEMCLLHEKNDAYNGAYDRAPLAQERRKIMQAWGDYCMKEFRKK